MLAHSVILGTQGLILIDFRPSLSTHMLAETSSNGVTLKLGNKHAWMLTHMPSLQVHTSGSWERFCRVNYIGPEFYIPTHLVVVPATACPGDRLIPDNHHRLRRQLLDQASRQVVPVLKGIMLTARPRGAAPVVSP